MGHVEKTKWYEWRMHLVSGNAIQTIFNNLLNYILSHLDMSL